MRPLRIVARAAADDARTPVGRIRNLAAESVPPARFGVFTDYKPASTMFSSGSELCRAKRCTDAAAFKKLKAASLLSAYWNRSSTK